MERWIWYIIIPFVMSVCLTPIVNFIGGKLDVYAEMNNRTVHTKKIARIGGLAIYLSFILSLSVFLEGADDSINAILIGGTVMFLGGLLDDMVNLKPLQKLGFQIIAAFILMFYGSVSLEVIRLPLNVTINMGLISIIVTLIWITGITNAVNLIDGLDGLAGGIATIMLLVMASLAMIEGREDICILSLILAGSCIGFLVFNMHPASIFMGDCGALFLGFIISAISLLGFQSSTLITLGLPILLMAVPIIDTLSAILRRALNGKKFTEADKNHLHHVLMRRFGHRNTVLILYAVTALFGAVSYVYIINTTIGLIMLAVLLITFELFIEVSHMISPKYKPILGFIHMITKKENKVEIELEKEFEEKE